MTSDSILSSLFTSERDIFLSTLLSFTILDLGIIKDTDPVTGKANVLGSQIVNGKRILYENAEIIYPGNPSGVFKSACNGTACLIFMPASCMPNIQEGIVRGGARAYSPEGIKVLPIGNGTSPLVSAEFDSSGVFTLSSSYHKATFAEEYAELRKDGNFIGQGLSGNFYMHFEGDGTGKLQKDIDDDGIKQVYECNTEENGTVKWYDTIDPATGDRTFEQKKVNAGSEDTLFKISVSGSGAVTFSTSEDLTLEGNNVAINSTGTNSKVSINGTNLEVDK